MALNAVVQSEFAVWMQSLPGFPSCCVENLRILPLRRVSFLRRYGDLLPGVGGLKIETALSEFEREK
jgi:hypothetical protein